MPEESTEGKPVRRLIRTRQFYGFVGETDYEEEFIKELERDFEESGEI